jgi:hypothetical protein
MQRHKSLLAQDQNHFSLFSGEAPTWRVLSHI